MKSLQEIIIESVERADELIRLPEHLSISADPVVRDVYDNLAEARNLFVQDEYRRRVLDEAAKVEAVLAEAERIRKEASE